MLVTFKFGVHVDYSKSQPSNDKLSLKRAWSLSCDLFNFWKISDNVSTVQDSLLVSSKFQILSIKVCCKVSSGENFQRQSCSYIVPLSDGP